MPAVRLGVIGTGLIWIRTHKAILATMADAFEPVAFCDVSEERRAAVAQEFPNAEVFSDYQSLLAREDIEAVLVLTPLALNAPMAHAVLQAGKHVIMEKPIARSVAEGRALIAAAKQAGRRLCITEQLGYRRAEALLAEALASGEIGELVLWNRVVHMEGVDRTPEPLRYESTPWRKQADFPLGTMFDGGIHLIAALAEVFGAPQSVDATGKKLQPEYGEYDHIAVLLQYGQGFTGLLSFSTHLQLPPGQNRFQLYGSKGTITLTPEQLLVEPNGQPARSIALPKENAYVNMWHDLRQAFLEQREPHYTAEMALRDVATLEAISQSIKAGSRVAIELRREIA
jgi:scyllo-inositol 2-dehydrogenase (NADP+)